MELKRIKSFVTVKFDTPSGWLEEGQYSLTENADAYWVLVDGARGGIPGREVEKVPLDTDMSGLTEVHIIGNAAYNLFEVEKGKLYQEETTVDEYWKAATIRNHPIPAKELSDEEVAIIKSSIEPITKL